MPDDFPGWDELQVGDRKQTWRDVRVVMSACAPASTHWTTHTGSGAFGRPFCERRPGCPRSILGLRQPPLPRL